MLGRRSRELSLELQLPAFQANRGGPPNQRQPWRPWRPWRFKNQSRHGLRWSMVNHETEPRSGLPPGRSRAQGPVRIAPYHGGIVSRKAWPTLVIAAGDDTVTPLDHAQTIARQIPTARLTVIPGQRHFSNVEVPGAFNPLLRDFLDEVSNPRAR